MDQKGFINILVIYLLVVLIVGIGYFVLSQKQEKAPTVTNTPISDTYQDTQPSTQTPNNKSSSTSERKSISSTLISFPKYGNGTFSIPTVIQQGTEIILRWTSDKFLLGWGDKVHICLIALDTKNR